MFRTNTADPVVFTLTPPECFMEIRNGYGLTGEMDTQLNSNITRHRKKFKMSS